MSGERITLDYKNLSHRFSKQTNDYNKQYCSIYTIRLQQMTAMLMERVSQKWGAQYPVLQLHKLSENDCEKCVVIGTLFKDQKLKPSLLKQISESNNLLPPPVLTHFTDESDVLYIEDELQRYQLIGLEGKNYVTGITCALLGTDMGKGKFMVHDLCFVDYRPQIERPIKNEDRYVVFISGLDLVNLNKTLLPLRLFTNWIAGILGDINDIKTSHIARVIIAGNSARTQPERKQPTISLISKTVVANDTLEAVKLLDTFLLQLVQLIDVDVMPGKNDPANHILPQHPMHHCLFPKAMAYKSLHNVPNPYECDFGGVRILGSSGQPVTDILAFSEIVEPIEALENCLKWGHVAPTAPDTLGCYPFYESDPFVVEDCPHVMFAGNQEKFETKLAIGDDGQMVRLICIPEFASKFTAVVLNLKNLECEPITFS